MSHSHRNHMMRTLVLNGFSVCPFIFSHQWPRNRDQMGRSMAAAQQTSTAKLPATFQIFLKTVPVLRIKESKLTSRNAFIFNFFALESEKDFKKDERTLLCGLPVES